MFLAEIVAPKYKHLLTRKISLTKKQTWIRRIRTAQIDHPIGVSICMGSWEEEEESS